MNSTARSRNAAGWFFGFVALMVAFGTYNHFVDGNYKSVFAQTLFVLLLAALATYLLRVKTFLDDPEALRRDMQTKRDAIACGEYRYRGCEINPDTILVQFLIAASFGFVSHKSPSRYYVVGQEPTRLVRFLSTGLSLLLGWWGLPHGPVYTVEAVGTNLSGGLRTSVRGIVSGL